MRSRELAALADVTVRTLRHYHKVGILDEPRRSANGYREYDFHDLIRVLRIRRLAALGIGLDKVSALLDDDHTGSGDLLDNLDRELQERIAHLTQQRELLARIKAGQSSADVPFEVGRYLARVGASSPGLLAAERDHAVLLHHLLGDATRVPSFYAQFDEPEQLELMARAAHNVASLSTDSSDEDIEASAAELVSILTPAITAIVASSVGTKTSRGAAELVDGLWSNLLNPVQREVMRRLERHFAEGGAE